MMLITLFSIFLNSLGYIKHQIGTVELLTDTGIIPPMTIVSIESLDRTRDLKPSNAGQGVYEGVGESEIPQSGGAPKSSYSHKSMV